MRAVLPGGALPAPAAAARGGAAQRLKSSAQATALLSLPAPSRFGQVISSTVPFSPRK